MGLLKLAKSLQNGADTSRQNGTSWIIQKKKVTSVPQSEQLARVPEPSLPKVRQQSY